MNAQTPGVLVYAGNLRVAGGRTVATNVLRVLPEIVVDCRIWAIPPDAEFVDSVDSRDGTIEWLEPAGASNAIELLRSVGMVRRQVRKVRPEVLFALGNFAFPVRCPQVVLFHWPYALYDDVELWSGMSLRERLARRLRRLAYVGSWRWANRIAVQTEVARKRIRTVAGWTGPTDLVPNAVTVQYDPAVAPSGPRALSPGARPAFLCLSRYYHHKNIEILLDVGCELDRRGIDAEIHLTVDADQGPGARALVSRLEAGDGAGRVTNLGPIPLEDVPDRLAQSAGLLLPTLLESFTGTFVEATSAGVPVLTSDRDFAHAVLGAHAYYFDPLSAVSIASAVQDVIRDPVRAAEVVASARQHLEQSPSWYDSARRLWAAGEEARRGGRERGFR